MKLYELSGLDINLHCIKSVHIQSFSGLYFPAFGLNMERFEVTRDQKNSEYGHLLCTVAKRLATKKWDVFGTAFTSLLELSCKDP